MLGGEYSIPEFEFLAGNEWVFTEKVDGTNIRVMYSPDQGPSSVTFGGKTGNAQLPAFLVERLVERFHSVVQRDLFLDMFPDGACLYGEGYGAKIQKGGGNYREDQDFVLFDVKVGDWWLQRSDVEDVAEKLGIDVVPITGQGNLEAMATTALMGFNSSWGSFMAEGIVARPKTELKTRGGQRIITKIKYRDFRRDS